ELERVLNSRAYRYLMRPAQRAAGVIRRPPRPALPPASRVRSQDVGPEDEANSFEDSVEDGSTAPPLRYHIHGPEAGQEVEEDLVVTVAGWVFAEESPVARVEIWADGVYVANARLGIASPDAADELDRPDAYLSGFESLVEVSDRAPGGASTFDIWVVTLGGRRYRIFSVTVRLPGDGRVPSRLPRVTPRGDVRLLVFTHDLGLGGAQLYLFELLRQLAKGSDFSAVVVSHTDGALREPTEALGI